MNFKITNIIIWLRIKCPGTLLCCLPPPEVQIIDFRDREVYTKIEKVANREKSKFDRLPAVVVMESFTL